MTAVELTPSQMKRRLPAELRAKVDTALDQWLGLGLYRDGDGYEYLVSYGRGGDIGYSNPPIELRFGHAHALRPARSAGQ